MIHGKLRLEVFMSIQQTTGVTMIVVAMIGLFVIALRPIELHQWIQNAGFIVSVLLVGAGSSMIIPKRKSAPSPRH